MDHITETKYLSLLKKIENRFQGDGELDLNGVLFLIGVQELGHGFRKYSKDEKMNLIHIAICTILTPHGFYEFSHNDEEGWPHFQMIQKLPGLNKIEQEELLKSAIVDYFEVNQLL